jgi:plasmid replication initiation protein
MSIDEKFLTIRQSNSLIDASYRIASIGEGRLIRALIAKINPNDEDFKLYRVSVQDFARLFEITDQAAYEQIKKAADELTSRKIRIENGKSWLFMNWLSSAEYIHGNGYIELCFDKKLKPYLLQLKGYFTQYELENVITFKSSYSMRIFELLKAEQFKAGNDGKFKRIFKYDGLRKTLGIEETEYSQFAYFRVNVVEIAVREINANSNIKITQVDYPKTGRKVSHVVFYCERAKRTRIDVEELSPTLEEVSQKRETPDDVRELVSMGIDEATAYKWRKKYGVKRLTRNIAYTRAIQKSGKIRDSLTGFLARAITDNLGSAWEEDEKRKREIHMEREQDEASKREEEARRTEQQRAWLESTLTAFSDLTEDRKAEIRRAYASTLSDIIRKSFDKDQEKAPMHRMKFAKFFADQKGICSLIDEERLVLDGLCAVAVLNKADAAGQDNEDAIETLAEFHQLG